MEKYHFGETEIPEESGIYFIYGETDELLYIGKSTNLKARLYSHFKRTSSSKFKYIDTPIKSFSFIFVEEEQLDLMEKKMILKYLPLLNKPPLIKNGIVRVNYEIEEDLHDELKIRAIREKRNVSEIVNEIIKKGLKL